MKVRGSSARSACSENALSCIQLLLFLRSCSYGGHVPNPRDPSGVYSVLEEGGYVESDGERYRITSEGERVLLQFERKLRRKRC